MMFPTSLPLCIAESAPSPSACLAQILAMTPNPLFVLNEQQQWVVVNEALCRWCDRPAASLLTHHSRHLFTPAAAHRFQAYNAVVFATGEATAQTEVWQTPEGRSQEIIIQRSRFYDQDGTPFLLGLCQPAESAPSLAVDHGTLLQALPDLVMRMTGEGLYLDFIPTETFPVFGDHKLVGTEIFGTLPPELVERRMDYIQTALATGELQIYEQEILVEGILRTEEVRVVVSGPNEVLIIVRDMTDRKRVESALAALNEDLEARIQERTNALRESEARWRTLVNNLPFGCWAADIQGKHMMQNPVSLRQWGNLLGKRPQDLDLPPNVLDQWLDNNRRVLNGEILHHENQYIEQGQVEYYQSLMAPIWDNNEICGFLGVDINITQQKQIEAAVRQQEKQLQLVLANMPVMMTAFDDQGLVQAWNSECERVTGYTAQEMIGNPAALHWLYPDPGVRKRLKQRWRTWGNHFRNQEWPIACRDGSQRTILWSNLSAQFPIPGWTGWSVGIDISDRKQVEEALRANEEKTRALLEVIPDMLFCFDRDGVHLDFAPSSESEPAVAPDLFLGKSVVEVLPTKPAQRILNAVRAALATQQLQRIEYRLQLNGVWHDYEARILAIDEERALSIVRDITEPKARDRQLRDSEQQLRQQAQALTATLQELQHTQTQLIQTEKMSSLGQLVAGVAHEINNPVNFIFGNLTYLNEYIHNLLQMLALYQRHYPDPVQAIQQAAEQLDLEFIVEDLPKTLRSMRVGSERIQGIVASLRTFSRMDEAEMKAVNIHDGIDSTLMILQSRLKGNTKHPEILVQKHYAELPLIECYAGQLNQVFMNVLVNAIDAIAEGGTTQTPTITITTEWLTPEQIAIRIADNGPGMTAAVQKRLFDPFFTTKAVGKGTGMGLSISYQVVTERHGGQLTCHSELGQGTQFCIQIPIAQSRPHTPTAQPDRPPA